MQICFAQTAYSVVVWCLPLLLDGIGQAITGLQDKFGLVLQAALQLLEFGAAQCAGGGHHAHAMGLALQGRRFDRRLDTKHRQIRISLAQFVNGQGGGRIASDHQSFDLMLLQQRVKHMMGALQNKCLVSFTIRRKPAVCQIHKGFVWQLGLQSLQNAQSTHATVKHPDRCQAWERHVVWQMVGWQWLQRLVTAMPLNSPLAMRLDHSAGPVMWALVPPASTATVTGMSTTSNS